MCIAMVAREKRRIPSRDSRRLPDGLKFEYWKQWIATKDKMKPKSYMKKYEKRDREEQKKKKTRAHTRNSIRLHRL